MSTLSSSSTIAEAHAAYADNLSYEEDESTSKAAAFISACKLLIHLTPKMASHGRVGGRETQEDWQKWAHRMKEARQWLAARATAGQVKRLSVENFRT